MTTEHLSLNPTDATPEIWFYEQPKGLEFHDSRSGGKEVFTLTWAQLRAALKRYDTKPAPKPAKRKRGTG